MNNVAKIVRHTVAVRAPSKGIPVPGVDNIEGITITMYVIVKKVVNPAIISVRVVVFCIKISLKVNSACLRARARIKYYNLKS